MEDKILKVLSSPMKAGEIAEAAGMDKKEVDSALKKLMKERKVHSPKRCYYAATEQEH